MKYTLLLAAVLLMPAAYGQVTIGADAPPQATLDVVGTADDVTPVGIIAPRLTGDELQAKDALYTAAQTGTIVYVTAATTAVSDKTANVTGAGYYYFDGALWQALKGESGDVSPWNAVGSNGTDTGNTQNIYHMGSVGVGTQNPKVSAALEVASANKGFLPPRLTLASTTDVTTIPNPEEGLLVYSHPFTQTESNGSSRTYPDGIYMYDGTKWIEMIASNDNSSGRPVRNRTGVLVQVNQTNPAMLSGTAFYGLLLQNSHNSIAPAYDFGNWSPTTRSATDVITSTLGADGAMLVEKKQGGMLTYWRLGFEYVMGNNPPAATRYFTVNIVAPNGGVVYSEAIIVPESLNTGHAAPFSMFFPTIADPSNEGGYRIQFNMDTAASNGLPNNISVRLKQILKID